MASRSLLSPVVSRLFADALLAAIAPSSTDDHLIVSPKIALLGTPSVTITPDTTKAVLDAEEVAFSGYTAGGSAITLTTPGVVRGSDRFQLLAGNLTWVLTTADPLVTATVYGAYLYDTTFGLIAAGYFDEVVNLGNVGDYLDLFAGVPVLLSL